LVLRHPSHGKSFAAKRVGEQMLEGFHLPTSTFLLCLHDAHLQTTHSPLSPIPVNLVPVWVVGGRTSSRFQCGYRRAVRCCRHLLHLLDRFAGFS
jgi:hypothetical protein